MSAADLKAEAGGLFKAGDHAGAIDKYTAAIELAPEDHTLYANRSAAKQNLKQWDSAIEDAEKCISIKPDWGKGYWRKGLAQSGKGDAETAVQTFQKGLEAEPGCQQLVNALKSMQPPEDPIFGPAGMAKLMANPRTKAYFDDVMFKNQFELCKTNPQMLMQVMQSDPRFMDVFQTCTGIDLMGMQQKAQEQKEEDDRAK